MNSDLEAQIAEHIKANPSGTSMPSLQRNLMLASARCRKLPPRMGYVEPEAVRRSVSKQEVREMFSLRLAYGVPPTGESGNVIMSQVSTFSNYFNLLPDVALSVKDRAKRKCEECGKPAPAGHIHHKIVTGLEHLADYNDPTNLLFLCQRCHRKQEIHGRAKENGGREIAEYAASHPKENLQAIANKFGYWTQHGTQSALDEFGVPRLHRVMTINGKHIRVAKLYGKVVYPRLVILHPPVRRDFDYLAGKSKHGWFIFPATELPKKHTTFVYEPHEAVGKTRSGRHDWMKYFEAWPDPRVREEILKLRV